MEKRPFFRAATAGLGKYHTAATVGLGSIGLKGSKESLCPNFDTAINAVFPQSRIFYHILR